MSAMFQDGLPSMVPPVGSEMMLHCFVDGEISKFVAMVALAKYGCCHVSLSHHPDDDDFTTAYVCHVSEAPIPATEVASYVTKLFERATRGRLFQWIDSLVESNASQDFNPWQDEYFWAMDAGKRPIPTPLSVVS